MVSVFFKNGVYSLICPDVAVRDSEFVYRPPTTCREFLEDNGINAKNLYHALANKLPECGQGQKSCACKRARRDSSIIQEVKYQPHFTNVGIYVNLTGYEDDACNDVCPDVYYAVLQTQDPRACACVNLRGCVFEERNFTLTTKLSSSTSGILVIPNDFVTQVYMIDCNHPEKFTNDTLGTIIRCERLGLGIKYTRPPQCADPGTQCFYDTAQRKWAYRCEDGQYWQENTNSPCKECTSCEAHEYVALHCTPTHDTICKKKVKETTGMQVHTGICDVGLYYDAQTLECKRCPFNQYAQNSTCQPCPDHYDSKHVSTGHTCTPCQRSFYRTPQDAECIPCPPGFERNLTEASCRRCPVHTVNPGGHPHCIECGASEASEQNTCVPCANGQKWMPEKGICDFCPQQQVLRNNTCQLCTLSPHHQCPREQYLDDCTDTSRKPCVCGCRSCNNLKTDSTGTCHDNLLCSDLSYYYNNTLARCVQRKPLRFMVQESDLNTSTFDIRDQSTQRVIFCKYLFTSTMRNMFATTHRIEFANGTDMSSKKMKDTVLLAELPHQMEIDFFTASAHCAVRCVPGSQWLRTGPHMFQCVQSHSMQNSAGACILNVSNNHDARIFDFP